MGATFEQHAAELYRLPPKDFTARRKALAAEVREADAGMSKELARLPKPVLAAWAVDVFAHERPDELAELLDLGAELREAQQELSRDRLKDLTSQAHTLVQQVVEHVRWVADEAGAPLGDPAVGQVEQTLRAAMADRDAADAVRAGLLARPLQPGGFGAVDLSGAVAGSPEHVPAQRRTTTRDPRHDDGKAQERDREAERALHEAEDRLRDAERELGAAQDGLVSAKQDRATAEQLVARLRDDLHEAEERLRSATEQVRAADREAQQADKRVRSARRHLDSVRPT